MDIKAFDRILRRIIVLGHQIETPFAGEPDHFSHVDYGRTVFLVAARRHARIRDYPRPAQDTGLVCTVLARVCSAVCKDPVGIRLSGRRSPCSRSVRRFVDELDAFTDRQTVFLPITGVELDDCSEWERGPIELHQATEDFLQTFCDGTRVTCTCVGGMQFHCGTEARPGARGGIVRSSDQCASLLDGGIRCPTQLPRRNRPRR